jgi:hypothetical protein
LPGKLYFSESREGSVRCGLARQMQEHPASVVKKSPESEAIYVK